MILNDEHLFFFLIQFLPIQKLLFGSLFQWNDVMLNARNFEDLNYSHFFFHQRNDVSIKKNKYIILQLFHFVLLMFRNHTLIQKGNKNSKKHVKKLLFFPWSLLWFCLFFLWFWEKSYDSKVEINHINSSSW